MSPALRTRNRSGRASRIRPCAGFGILAPCVLWWGCAASGQRQLPVEAAPPVTVVELEPSDVPIYADFAAQTFARNLVEVRARVEGYIDRWLFRPGSEVTAGQVLYILDLRPYEAAVEQARGNFHQSEADLEFAKRQVSLLRAQAELASAQANLVKARQDYERLVPMVQADAASKQDLDAATAAMKANEANVNALEANVDQVRLTTRTQIDATQGKAESAKAALRAAELNLQYGTLVAPVSGRIGDSLIPAGGLVMPNAAQPLTTIVPLDPIWVRFKVTEADYLSWSAKGQGMWHGELRLILADGCDFPWKGRIDDSLNQFDPKTGTLELQGRFPNPQHTVLPGQFGRVRVRVDQRKDALIVPQRAVQQLQGIQVVYTVGADNRVVQEAVSTGPRIGDGWVIERGLQPGSRIIVEGQLKVRPGESVKPLPYRAAPASGGTAGGN